MQQTERKDTCNSKAEPTQRCRDMRAAVHLVVLVPPHLQLGTLGVCTRCMALRDAAQRHALVLMLLLQTA